LPLCVLRFIDQHHSVIVQATRLALRLKRAEQIDHFQ